MNATLLALRSITLVVRRQLSKKVRRLLRNIGILFQHLGELYEILKYLFQNFTNLKFRNVRLWTSERRIFFKYPLCLVTSEKQVSGPQERAWRRSFLRSDHIAFRR